MEKIWLKQYHPEVPAEIDADVYASLGDMIVRTCARYADQSALSNYGCELNYSEVRSHSEAFAAFLQGELKVTKGDQIAIMLPNLLQSPIILCGVWLAGAVVVNINPFYKPVELEQQLDDMEVKIVVVLNHFAHTVEAIRDKIAFKDVIVTEVGDLFPWPKRPMANLYAKYLRRHAPSWSLPGYYSFRNTLKKGRKLQAKLPPVKVDSNDLACLQFTGGTTGTPKAAMLTHRNLLANVEQVRAWVKPFLHPGKEVAITALPIYHIFALTANVLAFFRLGAKNVLITDPRDLANLEDVLVKTPYTVLTGVNTLFKGLLRRSKFVKSDFTSLKFVLGGGMPVHQSVAEKWQEVTGVLLYEGYGLTEASPGVAISNPLVQKFTGSVGLPLPSTEIKVIDNDGNELPNGEVGELCVRGPQVMKGYWRNRAETEKVLTADGWLHTGDLVQVDKEGYLFLVDRKKDLIIVSGFNVYPNEVETVLNSHPSIKETGVVGVEVEGYGEIVKAFVVSQDKELSKGDVIAYCRQRLTTYKVPKEIEFVETLPKNMIGKVKRNNLSSAP